MTNTKWHSHYCDPQADITLVSNDGVHFKVSIHHMCRASGLFANMRDSATPSATSDPLSIDAESDLLEIFLDLVCSAHPNTNIKLEHCLSLLPLCDFFDSPSTSALVSKRLEDLVKTKPEEIFVTACRMQDVQLAKSAVRNMSSLAHRLFILRSAEDKGGFLATLTKAISKHLPYENSHEEELVKTAGSSDIFANFTFTRSKGWWEKVENDFNPIGDDNGDDKDKKRKIDELQTE